MKALPKERPGPGLVLRDITEPKLVELDDVKFRVAYCAICVGKIKVYDWDSWAASDTTFELPTVLGHEVSAVVTETGPAVRHCSIATSSVAWLVLLVRGPLGATPTYLVQQFAHVLWRVGHTKMTFNHFANPQTSPDIAPKPMCFPPI